MNLTTFVGIAVILLLVVILLKLRGSSKNRGTSYTIPDLTWNKYSAVGITHYYRIFPDKESEGKFVVSYFKYKCCRNKVASGFTSVDEARSWANDHARKKILPFLEPML